MRNRSFAVPLATVLAAFAYAGPAMGDDTIRRPGDHPNYAVEIEPHALWGWTQYRNTGNDGFGLGARFSIPIVQNGFIPTINNSVAISFGVDWLHYAESCFYYFGPGANSPCYGGDANYLFFPVALQWNFFVARQWSVFGEPGLVIYHGFFNYCPSNVPPNTVCNNPSDTGVDFAFYVGGRWHFSDHASLTMRIGYPTFSVGVSFL